MLILLLQNKTCGTLPFERDPVSSEYALTVTLRERAIEQFIKCNFNNKIPLSTPISNYGAEYEARLGFTSVKVYLRDV